MLNKVLLIVIGILCIFIGIASYIFITRKNNAPQKTITPSAPTQHSQKTITIVNDLDKDLLINENKLHQYYSRFHNPQTRNAYVVDSLLSNTNSIEIVITHKKPEKKYVFFSIPPDINQADIVYGRINSNNKIQLVVYLNSKILENRSTEEIKKIIELQALEILYLVLHPEINGTSTLTQDAFTQIEPYISEIGSLFD